MSVVYSYEKSTLINYGGTYKISKVLYIYRSYNLLRSSGEILPKGPTTTYILIFFLTARITDENDRLS